MQYSCMTVNKTYTLDVDNKYDIEVTGATVEEAIATKFTNVEFEGFDDGQEVYSAHCKVAGGRVEIIVEG